MFAFHPSSIICILQLKLYAQSTTISLPYTPARITDGYIAVAASREEIIADAIHTDFVKAWLHIAVIVFPIITGVLLYICDPVHLLLGDRMWQTLEDEHNHPTIAALIQISVEVTIYVFILDWFGFVYTIRGNFISTGNSAFYLSVITGMIVDVSAFIWVMFVMATSCHWDCKNMWYRWRNQSCPLETSKRIKKLLCTVMFAPILCIANHFHYIILAFISDPYHAGSITIVYGLSFFLHYFIFRQFYARVALHSGAKRNPNQKPTQNLESPHRDLCQVNSTSSTKPLQDQQQNYNSQKVPFLTHVVTIGLIFVAPLLVFYEAVIIVLFVMLPITKTIEDAPTRIYSLYQGTGILIVALLTYSIILHPNPFSLPKAIHTVAKELHLPEKMPNWNKLSDEDKFARCVTTLYLGGEEEKEEVEVDSKSNVRKINNVIAVEMAETTL